MKVFKINNFSFRLLALGLVLMLYACTENEELPIVATEPTLNDPNLPPELLTEIFTDDIPEEIKNVDDFLQRIEANGMKIYRGINPNNRYLNEEYKYKYVFKNQCIYDETNSENIGKTFGDYVDSISFYYEINNLVSDLAYYSKEGNGFPQYPDEFDKGDASGGYVSGSPDGNNFTVFYRATSKFDNVNYEAIWIVSFSIQISTVTILKDMTKCLVMVNKDPDPAGKVASIGAVRIFRDDAPKPEN